MPQVRVLHLDANLGGWTNLGHPAVPLLALRPPDFDLFGNVAYVRVVSHAALLRHIRRLEFTNKKPALERAGFN